MELRASLRKESVTPPSQRAAAQRRRTVVAPPLSMDPARCAAALERLTDAIAHEAAQPMQALSSILREVQLRAQDDALAPLAAEGVRRLDELRVLQDELRDAVSLTRGERLRGTWVQSMLAAVRERLQPVADAAHVVLSLRSQPWWLRADGAVLRRVVDLLADNAIRHAGASAVTVRVFADSRNLLIAVRDDGAGIAPDRLAQIFAEPDAQAASAQERGVRHGHGLLICRMLLARLRGRLLVRSSARATTFFVHLPRPVLCAAPAAGSAAAAEAALQGHVIAMLDDDAAALSASARLFETLGARVMTFAEPLDLLAACPTMPCAPRLFILDYRLRDGTCQRVIEALRPWLKEDFHCVVLTGDDAVAGALPSLDGDIFVTTKPLADWALERILRFLRGETARVAEPPAVRT